MSKRIETLEADPSTGLPTKVLAGQELSPEEVIAWILRRAKQARPSKAELPIGSIVFMLENVEAGSKGRAVLEGKVVEVQALGTLTRYRQAIVLVPPNLVEDFGSPVRLRASDITLSTSVTGTVNVDLVAQTLGNVSIDLAAVTFAGNLSVDLAAQSVGNITVDIAAQSMVGNLTVDIAAQTVGNLSIDIAAQTVGNLNVNLAASAITLNINISSQTANVNIDIAAQTVGNLNVNLAASAATVNVSITASSITLNVAIQSSAVTLNVNVASQGVFNFNVDIAEQSVGNISINIAASAVTLNVNLSSSSITLNINISSQSANVSINIAAQAVNLEVQRSGNFISGYETIAPDYYATAATTYALNGTYRGNYFAHGMMSADFDFVRLRCNNSGAGVSTTWTVYLKVNPWGPVIATYQVTETVPTGISERSLLVPAEQPWNYDTMAIAVTNNQANVRLLGQTNENDGFNGTNIAQFSWDGNGYAVEAHGVRRFAHTLPISGIVNTIQLSPTTTKVELNNTTINAGGGTVTPVPIQYGEGYVEWTVRLQAASGIEASIDIKIIVDGVTNTYRLDNLAASLGVRSITAGTYSSTASKPALLTHYDSVNRSWGISFPDLKFSRSIQIDITNNHASVAANCFSLAHINKIA